MGHDKLHATEHTDGTDDIQTATAAVKGLMAAAAMSKLDNIDTGATKSTYAEQSNVYFASHSKGNDSNDGSMFSPVATPLKAIELGEAAGYDEIFVYIDMTYDSYAQFQLPDELIVSLSCWGAVSTENSLGIILGEATVLKIDNLTAGIWEKVGQTEAYVYMEEGALSTISNSGGTGNPTTTEIYTNTVYIDAGVITQLKNAAVWFGTAMDLNNGTIHFSDDIELNNNKVTNMANGSAATDGAAFGQIPTTLPGLDSTAIHKATEAEISAIAGKATPIDADVVVIEDSADATPFAKKSLTWANIKATLKTYLDTIYLAKDTYQADISLAGATPIDADVSGWADGDRGHGIGTTGKEFYMIKRGTAVKYVEMS